jgi:hypothetical protein
MEKRQSRQHTTRRRARILAWRRRPATECGQGTARAVDHTLDSGGSCSARQAPHAGLRAPQGGARCRQILTWLSGHIMHSATSSTLPHVLLATLKRHMPVNETTGGRPGERAREAAIVRLDGQRSQATQAESDHHPPTSQPHSRRACLGQTRHLRSRPSPVRTFEMLLDVIVCPETWLDFENHPKRPLPDTRVPKLRLRITRITIPHGISRTHGIIGGST